MLRCYPRLFAHSRHAFSLIAMVVGAMAIAVPPCVAQERREAGGLNDEELRTATDFQDLFEERETLLPQVDRVAQRMWELGQQIQFISDTFALKNDSARAVADLELERTRTNPDEWEIARIQDYMAMTNRNLVLARTQPAELARAEADYDSLRRRLLIVEQRIASSYDRSRDLNSFRKTITLVFAILVFFVISGFYLIAWHKQGVATTIFSGEMGMQFVTLFLIVIAIILFGMLGTLEGRELGPLLGGLSGYILGRQSGRSISPDPAPEPPPPANAAPHRTNP